MHHLRKGTDGQRGGGSYERECCRHLLFVVNDEEGRPDLSVQGRLFPYPIKAKLLHDHEPTRTEGTQCKDPGGTIIRQQTPSELNVVLVRKGPRKRHSMVKCQPKIEVHNDRRKMPPKEIQQLWNRFLC